MVRSKREKVPQGPEVRVILFGVGAIGSSIARLLLKKKGVKIVGAIDAAPDKVGKDLGEVIGTGEHMGVTVSRDADEVLSQVKADVTVHATSSFLRDVHPQLVALIENGVDVVSTCEELTYPYIVDADVTAELDRLAKRHDVTVLGTGVNPGFLMDTLAITLTGVCQEIRSIKVERVMDAGKRRLPFQKKIGAGLTVQEFEDKIESKAITGHVGLEQSIAMIADALGWNLQRIEIGAVEPIVARRQVESKDIRVESGQVAGLSQSAFGIKGEEPVIALSFQAYIGAQQEYDSVTIEGTPSIHQKITPCVHGDLATAAIVVNSIPKVINAPSGLETMKDLPIPSAAIEDMRLYVERQRSSA